MLLTIVLAFAIATLLSAACVWVVARWASVAIPIADLLIIVGLCSGLSLFPTYGWLLASIFLILLLTRATKADLWPEGVLMVVGSNVAWMIVKVTILGWP